MVILFILLQINLIVSKDNNSYTRKLGGYFCFDKDNNVINPNTTMVTTVTEESKPTCSCRNEYGFGDPSPWCTPDETNPLIIRNEFTQPVEISSGPGSQWLIQSIGLVGSSKIQMGLPTFAPKPMNQPVAWGKIIEQLLC